MKRTLALALALVLLCALFVVALGAEHDCTGENCQICCLMQTCLCLVSSLALCALLALVTVTAASCIRMGSRPSELIARFSLITQKVKLSN